MNNSVIIDNTKYIVYNTREGVNYHVYNSDDIEESDISDAIMNSDYFDSAYEYAKETIKKTEKRAGKAYYASKAKRKNLISSIRCGFDIEFTRVDDVNQESGEIEDARSYMYHWQFSINNLIICGRTWQQFSVFFKKFAKSVKEELKAALKRHNSRWGKKNHPYVIIWVANLPCEFQYIKDRIQWNRIFAKDTRKPITATVNTNELFNTDDTSAVIMFQDCLQITGGSLAKLAEDYTTTQKRSGDLDYEEKRNSLTPLTAEELHYCYDDVAILSEWHSYYYQTYSKLGYAPMTVTGILRHEVKSRQTVNDLVKVWNMFPSMDEQNNEYEYVMNWLFKGGYSHANLSNVNLEFDNEIYSWDITSSYPYVLLTYLYPMCKFTENKQLEDKINELSNDPVALHDYIDNTLKGQLLFYAEVEILLPFAKTNSTYISLSKTINQLEIMQYSGNYNTTDRFPVTILDNGRIMRTYRTVTVETDVDILTILEMYNYAQIKFSHVMCCFKLSQLPKYVTEPIETAYEKKARLKKQGLAGTVEYKIAKSMVNAGYGMMCTRLIINEIDYNTVCHKWETIGLNNVNLQDQLFLNPMWGIYVTAYARRRLMKMVITAGDDTAVCDTDSIYAKKTDRLVNAINAENERVIASNKIRFNNPCFDDLGCWDKQSVNDKKEFVPYERFATMGAKRYVLFGWNDGKYGWKQTIAGLPKKTLINFCKKYNNAVDKTEVDPQLIYNNKPTIDPLVVFLGRKGFGLSYTESEKKTTIYHDNPHSDVVTDKYGNTETMYEESSVSIVPIQFRMTINDMFIKAMEWFLSQNCNAKTERRIL